MSRQVARRPGHGRVAAANLAAGTGGDRAVRLSEVIHRARAELVRHRPELRLHVPCRSGGGAWLASIAPFEEPSCDERLVCGLTVNAAPERLERRYYAACRHLTAPRWPA